MRQSFKPLYFDDIKRIIKGNKDKKKYNFTFIELMLLQQYFGAFESAIANKDDSWDNLGVMYNIEYFKYFSASDDDNKIDVNKIVDYLKILGYHAWVDDRTGWDDKVLRVELRMIDVMKEDYE